MRPAALVGTLFLAGTLCGCLGLDPDLGLTLDWSVLEGGLPSEVEVNSGRATIHVVGHIPANLPCDPLSGDIERRGNTVRLTVTVIEEVNFCLGGPSTFRYAATVVNVQPGVERVVVEHRFENDDRPSEIVFEGDLDVS